MLTARPAAWLTWEALSVGVRWRLPLSVVVVTQLVTRFPRACSGATCSQAAIGYAHGSGGRGPHLSNLRIQPAWIRSLISPAANIIPRIFRIMETSALTARTLQGMARVRSGCTCMEAARIVRFSAWS